MKTTNNREFKKCTLAVATTLKGILGCILYEKRGMNTNCMILFLQQFVLKNEII